MIELNYDKMDFNELLYVIKECQKELDRRATTSTFRIEDYRKVKKTTYPITKE